MSLTFAMIAGGALMIYAGWTNRSLIGLALGRTDVAKPKLGVSAAGITGPVNG